METTKRIQISVKDKVACLVNPNDFLVCKNSDYEIEFLFDEQWADVGEKVALFVFGKNSKKIGFNGNVVSGIPITNASVCLVGVVSGNIASTTPAQIKCLPSIDDEAQDTEDYKYAEPLYAQLLGEVSNLEDKVEEIAKNFLDVEYAPLVDGKVPAENLPSYMDDVVEGAMETSFGNFYPSGEHNEKVDERGNVIPRKGVLYVDVNGAHIGKVFRWSGTHYVQVASTNLPDAGEWNKGQFLMSNGSYYTTEEVRQLPRISEASDSGKVLIVDDATRKAAWVTPPWVEKSYVDGLVGDISTALDGLHAYAQSLANGGSAE